MKKNIALWACLLLYSQLCAQKDTTFVYYNQHWKECSKDSATYLAAVFLTQQLWHRYHYYLPAMTLQMTGSFLDQSCSNGQGVFTWYTPEGTITMQSEFELGKKLNTTRFYPNGSKRTFISYISPKEIAWDENGKRLKGFVVERPPFAAFGWEKYLNENLNPNAAIKTGSISDTYNVTIEFTIDALGNISRVVPVSSEPVCAPCIEEAVNVISKSKRWTPAVKDNVYVSAVVNQRIIFQTGKTQAENYVRTDFW